MIRLNVTPSLKRLQVQTRKRYFLCKQCQGILLYHDFILVGPVGIWIAGGEAQASTQVEFVNLNSSTNQLPNLPKSINSDPSMFMHNETIMICGGWNNRKTCLKLQEGTWTEYNSLKEKRESAAVVSTTTATFIFGGWESKDTYEYLENNASNWILGTAKIPGGLLADAA